ncbi:hypothetical protein M8J76_012705 [Diaphorina citri]|nr:hypothetical protein M8J77_000250 [Diaphorina citri]KAI5709203.1 hypothetical protein M8J76_012705 [Diaphorina citri]
MPRLRDLAYSEGCEMKHRAKGHSKRCDLSILKRGSEMEEVPGRKSFTNSSFTKGHSKRCALSILKRGSEIEEVPGRKSFTNGREPVREKFHQF